MEMNSQQSSSRDVVRTRCLRQQAVHAPFLPYSWLASSQLRQARKFSLSFLIWGYLKTSSLIHSWGALPFAFGPIYMDTTGLALDHEQTPIITWATGDSKDHQNLVPKLTEGFLGIDTLSQTFFSHFGASRLPSDTLLTCDHEILNIISISLIFIYWIHHNGLYKHLVGQILVGSSGIMFWSITAALSTLPSACSWCLAALATSSASPAPGAPSFWAHTPLYLDLVSPRQSVCVWPFQTVNMISVVAGLEFLPQVPDYAYRYASFLFSFLGRGVCTLLSPHRVD